MMYRKRCILAGLAITGLCLMAVSNPVRSEAPPSETLAYVDESTITVSAFKAEMVRQTPQLTNQEQIEALLEEMVRLELIYTAALKLEYDKDPQILARFKRLIVNKYLEDVLEPRFAKVTVSDKEMEDHYNNHKADFVTSKMVRTAIIQINVPAHASKEKKAQLLKRAEAARVEALKLDPATSSFGPVAVKYSNHQPTRYRGGDSGWLEVGKGHGSWPEDVMEVVFSLKEIQAVSPVISSHDGYYLVKLMGTKEITTRPFATVKERIRHQLFKEKRALVELEFYEDLKATVPVRVDRTRLGAIEPPKGTTDKEARRPPGLPGQ
jgi:peptidyl-prolyl cis-trans isomerase C